MTLLLVYLALAIGVSFLCSLCEAVLLTLTPSDAAVMSSQGKKAGDHLRQMKDRIDRPLAAILTLNTISHTVGATGVGVQAGIVFGEAWALLTGVVLTLLILVLSEIIPKTIGATYARPLATLTIEIIRWMVWLTYPIVVLLNGLSRLIGGTEEAGLSREHLGATIELAGAGGALSASERLIITNLLRLQSIQVREVMTPRTVMQTIGLTATAEEAIAERGALRFSRIPVLGEGPDDVRGIVLKHDLYRAVLEGERSRPVASMLRPITPVPETASLFAVLEKFRDTGHHLFLVVDEHGGTDGIVTLEDVLETILGSEIVDETDLVADMRELARRRHPFGRAWR